MRAAWGIQLCEDPFSEGCSTVKLRSEDKVEAFQMYTLYCTTHRGQGSHSFVHFPTTKSLYINYMECTSFGQKRCIFLILVLCLCSDLYRFQQFLYRTIKLQAW